MSRRAKRQLKREWASPLSRRAVVAAGWLLLAAAIGGHVVFGLYGRFEALAAAGVAAVVAFVASGVAPEVRQGRRLRFAPLESMRTARRQPSLIRQLLTLP